MKKLKIGVVGVGNIALAHIQAYQKNDRVELYAFCDVDETRLKARAEEFGVAHTFVDLDEMLALPELDAVSVCTINCMHAPCALKAIRAGKHVLVEKPMATTLQDAEEMKAAAEKAGVLLMVGFVCRFGSDTAVMKDFIDDGALGEIYYAKASYLRRHGCPGGWFQNKELSGGGPLIDLGVHRIDQTRFLVGSPKPVSVYGAAFSKLKDRPEIKGGISSKIGAGSAGNSSAFDVEDFASAMVRFDNGFVMQVEASFTLNIKQDQENIELFGTKAGAKLHPLELYTDMSGYMVNTQLATPAENSFDDMFVREIDHFVSCILDGTPCMASAEDGVVLMQILDGIYRSAESGHEVIISK